jgi:abortive infection bacteriophage resistance protein
MDYDKQPINVEEQVALLQNRGLVIEDIATAKLQLLNIRAHPIYLGESFLIL